MRRRERVGCPSSVLSAGAANRVSLLQPSAFPVKLDAAVQTGLCFAQNRRYRLTPGAAAAVSSPCVSGVPGSCGGSLAAHTAEPLFPPQVAHRQRGAAGVQGRGRRVGAVPQRPRRLRAELLPGQGGRACPGGCCSQDLPKCIYQGGSAAPR